MSDITTETYCHCDDCDKKLIEADTTKTAFIRRAREAYGWSIGKYIKCISCKTKNPEYGKHLRHSDTEGEFL